MQLSKLRSSTFTKIEEKEIDDTIEENDLIPSELGFEIVSRFVIISNELPMEKVWIYRVFQKECLKCIDLSYVGF